MLQVEGKEFERESLVAHPSHPAPQHQEPSKESLIAIRAKLLADYIAATRASHRRIYLGNSGIHKPQFYGWMKGDLSPKSSTTKAFEAFLKKKRLPMPREKKTPLPREN